MALDARRRSSIFQKLIPLIGDDDANALMSEFPSVEADELVTRQFLRAELAELRTEMASLGSGLRGEIADLRTEMVERFRQQTIVMVGLVGSAVAVLGTMMQLG